MFDLEGTQTLLSLLGLLSPSEFFVTVDHSVLWQRHISWSKPKGEALRQYITQRYASNMVFLSCLLAAEINVFFNSSRELTDMRSLLGTMDGHSNLRYWIGIIIILDACTTLIALVTTFTLWGKFCMICTCVVARERKSLDVRFLVLRRVDTQCNRNLTLSCVSSSDQSSLDNPPFAYVPYLLIFDLGMVSSISDRNTHALLRSSIGQYVTSLPSKFTVASLYLFLLWMVLWMINLLCGFIQVALVLWVLTMFIFQVVIPLSAFGRLIIHTGAMAQRPVLDAELEQELLPSGLHASLLIRATDRRRKYASATDQYRKKKNNNNRSTNYNATTTAMPGSSVASLYYASQNMNHSIPSSARKSTRSQQQQQHPFHRNQHSSNYNFPPTTISTRPNQNNMNQSSQMNLESSVDELTLDDDDDNVDEVPTPLLTQSASLDHSISSSNDDDDNEDEDDSLFEGEGGELVFQHAAARGGHHRRMDTTGSHDMIFPRASVLNAMKSRQDLQDIILQSTRSLQPQNHQPPSTTEATASTKNELSFDGSASPLHGMSILPTPTKQGASTPSSLKLGGNPEITTDDDSEEPELTSPPLQQTSTKRQSHRKNNSSSLRGSMILEDAPFLLALQQQGDDSLHHESFLNHHLHDDNVNNNNEDETNEPSRTRKAPPPPIQIPTPSNSHSTEPLKTNRARSNTAPVMMSEDIETGRTNSEGVLARPHSRRASSSAIPASSSSPRQHHHHRRRSSGLLGLLNLKSPKEREYEQERQVRALLEQPPPVDIETQDILLDDLAFSNNNDNTQHDGIEISLKDNTPQRQRSNNNSNNQLGTIDGPQADEDHHSIDSDEAVVISQAKLRGERRKHKKSRSSSSNPQSRSTTPAAARRPTNDRRHPDNIPAGAAVPEEQQSLLGGTSGGGARSSYM